MPMWSSAFPLAYYPHAIKTQPSELKVVYFPSCINQTMGKSKGQSTPLIDKMVALIEKAGYEVIFPKNMKNLCCGTIWESKGMPTVRPRSLTTPCLRLPTADAIRCCATRVRVCTACATPSSG